MNTKTTPKDFFLHLGAAVALYIAAGSLINLWFAVINYFRPDALAGYFYGNAVAWPISMLVVLVPVLYVLEWMINRDIVRNPEKRDLWIRKWRIYLTLFLATILMAGDLIALINVYLNGEITSRFVYKIIVIVLVAGAVGKYYFFSLYPDLKWSALARRINPWFGIVFVLAAIVMGFVAAGSPATQRALRLDNQRVNDLSTIQWQVIGYWQQKESLPVTLADLADPISGFTIPTDPETKTEYGYAVTTGVATSSVSFELCATFSRPTQDTKGRGEYGYGRGGGLSIAYPAYDMSYPIMEGQDNWKHEAGKACFTRTIDPDKYPPIRPMPAETKAI
ncbi:MAG: DUF5671 domain-containing protein [Patescibacteria group bacterium]